MPEITDAELAELAELRRELADFRAERDERKAAAARIARGEKPLTRPRRALLADGSTHVFTGQHPTHVHGADGDAPVAVVTSWEL